MATRIVSRLREALQVDLSLRALFEKPTVASFSDYLETIRQAGKEHQLPATDYLDETEEITL